MKSSNESSGKSGERVAYNRPQSNSRIPTNRIKKIKKKIPKKIKSNPQKILAISLLIALFSLSATVFSDSQSGALTWETVKPKIIEEMTTNNLPGTLVDHLEPSTDTKFKERLQAIMIPVRYEYEYVEDVFDCSDQSKILHKYLEAHAYRAKIAYTYNEEDKCGHSWVVVADNDQRWVSIETITGNGCIGGIRTKGMWYGPMMLLNSTEETDMWPMFS